MYVLADFCPPAYAPQTACGYLTLELYPASFAFFYMYMLAAEYSTATVIYITVCALSYRVAL